MAGHRDDRRRAPQWLLLHVLAVSLLTLSGADNVVISSLAAAASPSHVSDPTEVSDGVGDFCRPRRDLLAEHPSHAWSRAVVRDEAPDGVIRSYRPHLWLSRVLSPLFEHASHLALRARSPG